MKVLHFSILTINKVLILIDKCQLLRFNVSICDRVFVFTGLGCGPGFADILQDGIPLFIFAILIFLGTTQLWREGPVRLCHTVNCKLQSYLLTFIHIFLNI